MKNQFISIKCDDFTKSDWEENCRQILEQVDAELMLGFRVMKFNKDDWSVEIKEK